MIKKLCQIFTLGINETYVTSEIEVFMTKRISIEDSIDESEEHEPTE